jgi:hypothetical protein
MDWWTANRIDNFGAYPDPEGAFPKPDSNIIVPTGTIFTTLFPGTVTGIDTSDTYGNVVTIKMDTPLNPAATHIAYLHLTSIWPGLKVGSHVTSGQKVGIGGGGASKSGAMPGVALTPSDEYGHGTGWADNVKGTWINPLLNPVPMLDAAYSGKLASFAPQSTSNASSSTSSTATVQSCAPWDIGCMMNNIGPMLINWGEHIAVFTIALLLIILGIYLLNQQVLAPGNAVANAAGGAASGTGSAIKKVAGAAKLAVLA